MSVSHLLQPGCQGWPVGEAGVLHHRAARTPGPGPRAPEGDLKGSGEAGGCPCKYRWPADCWQPEQAATGPGACVTLGLRTWLLLLSHLPDLTHEGLFLVSTTSDHKEVQGPHGSSLAKLMQCERMAVLRGKAKSVFYGSPQGMIFTVRGCE